LDRVIDGDIIPDEPMFGSTFVNFFATIWAAAADTTAVALLTNIRYLAAHPEVQRKAQAELDKVCGAHRPPTWADFDRLPYINCIMKEGLRIQGV
jgi:cytochrome P450